MVTTGSATGLPTDRPGSRWERGEAIRAEVLGAEHVRRARCSAGAFGRPVQDLVTEYCWGEIWDRPGLSRRARSLVNIAMLTALGRNHELGLHVRGAIRNGVTRQEVQEVLLQVTVYCGIPAGLEAFRVAEAALAELDADGPDDPVGADAAAGRASAAGPTR